VVFRSEDVSTVNRGLGRVLPEEPERAHQVSAVGAVVENMGSDGIHEGHAVGRVEGAVATFDREQANQRELTLGEHEGRLRGVAGHENVGERHGVTAVILHRVGSGQRLDTGGVGNAAHHGGHIINVKEILVAVVIELNVGGSLKSGDGRIDRSIDAVKMAGEDFLRHRVLVHRRIDGVVSDIVEHNGFRLTAVAIHHIDRRLISGTTAVEGRGLVVSGLVLDVSGETRSLNVENDIATVSSCSSI